MSCDHCHATFAAVGVKYVCHFNTSHDVSASPLKPTGYLREGVE